MGESAAQLRREIDETRQHMTMTVDAIEDRVTPGRIIERRRNRIRSSLLTARDRMMGVPQSVGSGLSDGGSAVRSEAGSLVHGVESRAEANPFGAGIFAFGAGMLAATLFPASAAEREVGAKARDAGEALREPMAEAAHSIADTAKEHGSEAVAAVKDAGASATASVTATAKEKAAETRGQVRQSGSATT